MKNVTSLKGDEYTLLYPNIIEVSDKEYRYPSLYFVDHLGRVQGKNFESLRIENDIPKLDLTKDLILVDEYDHDLSYLVLICDIGKSDLKVIGKHRIMLYREYHHEIICCDEYGNIFDPVLKNNGARVRNSI